MSNEPVLDGIRDEVKRLLAKDSTGHDFYHAMRVAQLGRYIAHHENADSFICEVAGLIHDIGRPMEKETGVPHWGPEALKQIEELLLRAGMQKHTIETILTCVAEHEQYGFLGNSPPKTIESRILQDADRLDAIGAIGIARAFMFAGAHGHAMWLPEEESTEWSPNTQSKDAINHFHEKLFKPTEEMHTTTGKRMARKRREVMEEYLANFKQEWRGESYES